MKKNTKIIRLTENDIQNLVQKIIKESNNSGSIEDYFSKEELAEIKEKATRLLSPGFFEDYEVTNYISTVSGNDKKVERMLVDWLKSKGLEFYQPEYRSDTGYFDYMADDQELLLQVDDISEMLGHEDMVGTFSDLADAVGYLEDEMYNGNHGPIMTKKIEDLLTQIYEVIGWPDDGEFEDEDYMEDETSTPIKPITIDGKTYKFVEDLPIRELGIGSYVVDNGIVLVNGDTPLQDWLDNGAED